MELRHYARILLRWWWLALVASIVVFVGSVVFTYAQSPKYEASATLVVSPTSAMLDLNEVRASLNTLDKPIIINTYAEIVQSRTIIQRAWNDLEVRPEDRRHFEARSSVLHETNIVLVTANGPDPSVVQSLTNAVAHHTVDYVSNLYEVYDLRLLDAAVYPESPTSPNEKLNLLLGSVVGVCFGILSAFVAEYLQAPIQVAAQLSIINADTGAYKQSYFLQRLREETSRSKRNQRPFSIARVKVDNLDNSTRLYPPETRDSLLRSVVNILKQTLRQEDVVASWKDGELTILLPDWDGKTTKQFLERLLTKIQWTPFKIEESGFTVNLTTSAGVATYDCNGADPDALLDTANHALQQAEVGSVAVYAPEDYG